MLRQAHELLIGMVKKRAEDGLCAVRNVARGVPTDHRRGPRPRPAVAVDEAAVQRARRLRMLGQ
jgi:hypothetical protein